jgi:pyruvate,orthophosphate dikinase
MIEPPRAAVLAGELARHADVFLVGTNDLTTLVWGIDRFGMTRTQGSTADPFARFDRDGVGRLLTQAIREARAANRD